MDYSARIDEANSYDYSDEPLQAVVDRLRDIVELQAREIMRLQHQLRQRNSRSRTANIAEHEAYLDAYARAQDAERRW